MKLQLTLLALLAFFWKSAAQDWNALAKADLKPLYETFVSKNDSLQKEKTKLTALTEQLSTDQAVQFQKTRNLKLVLDSLYNKRTTLAAFYAEKKVATDSLSAFFPEQVDFVPQENSPQVTKMLEEKTIYFLFGDNELIKEKELIKDKEINKIFSKVLSADSQSNLGKFEIPALGQPIPVYLECRDEKTCESKKSTQAQIDECKKKCTACKKNIGRDGHSKNWFKELCFEEVNITIKEGAFEDIRVTLIDKKTNEKYYFENRLSASMLRNTRNGRNFFLYNSFVTSIDNDKGYNHNELNNGCYISLKDVLQYYPNSGNNYVPDDQNLIFPMTNKPTQDKNTRSVYNLVQNTSLQNTVELRTYTDFLGLFNEGPNGVIQIEGRAEFFVNPFRFSKKGPFKSFYWFKKMTPYVNYAKIDDTNRGLELKDSIRTNDTISMVKHPLEIIEKSFLELGMNVNVASFKFIKEMPFNCNLYIPIRYNTTALYNDKEDNTNLKMVSYGLGVNLEFKKFSNFGLNFSTEFANYNPINRSDKVINPDKFWISRNEVEVFYYPGQSKNQSIFTRFRTFYNSNDDEDSFFQFQFGYRFSIGTGRVKSGH